MDIYRGVDVKALCKEFKAVPALSRQVSHGSKVGVNLKAGTKPVVESNVAWRETRRFKYWHEIDQLLMLILVVKGRAAAAVMRQRLSEC